MSMILVYEILNAQISKLPVSLLSSEVVAMAARIFLQYEMKGNPITDITRTMRHPIRNFSTLEWTEKHLDLLHIAIFHDSPSELYLINTFIAKNH